MCIYIYIIHICTHIATNLRDLTPKAFSCQLKPPNSPPQSLLGALQRHRFFFPAFWGVPAGASTIFLVVRALNWRDCFSAQHGSSLDAGITAERSHVASTDSQKIW